MAAGASGAGNSSAETWTLLHCTKASETYRAADWAAITETPMNKAVIYTRVSTDEQRAASHDDQARNCERWAQREGMPVTHRFTDHGISGSRTDRPQYRAMLAAAAAREFDVLLVDDLSRFGRDQIESERAIRQLEYAGVRIVAVSDGYDSTSKSRKVHRGVKQLFNEVYLDDLRDKTHRGLEGQADKQYWAGGRPYGYRLVQDLDPTRCDAHGRPLSMGTRLEPDPAQADTVRGIFNWFADGRSPKWIALELNRQGVPAPGSTWQRKIRRADGWQRTSIPSILNNELYIGRYHWNRTEWVKDPATGVRRARARPRSQWVTHEVPALRIVPDALWTAVKQQQQSGMKPSERFKRGGKRRYLLSGMMKCGSCGGSFVIADTHRYACNTHRDGGKCDNGHRADRELLEERILGPVFERVLAPDVVTELAQWFEREYRRRIEAATRRGDGASAEVRALEERIARLRTRLRDGDPDLTADELQAAIDRAESKRRELQDTKGAPSPASKVTKMLPRRIDEVRRAIVAARKTADPSTVERARTLLGQVLGGPVVLRSEGGSLFAEFQAGVAPLLKVAGAPDWNGSGGRI